MDAVLTLSPNGSFLSSLSRLLSWLVSIVIYQVCSTCFPISKVSVLISKLFTFLLKNCLLPLYLNNRLADYSTFRSHVISLSTLQTLLSQCHGIKCCCEKNQRPKIRGPCQQHLSFRLEIYKSSITELQKLGQDRS